jgi:hypothetical protein
MTQQSFHLDFVGTGVLMTDALASHVAGQFVQLQGNCQALLAGHAAVMLDLFLQSTVRIHAVSPQKSKGQSVTGRANQKRKKEN